MHYVFYLLTKFSHAMFIVTHKVVKHNIQVARKEKEAEIMMTYSLSSLSTTGMSLTLVLSLSYLYKYGFAFYKQCDFLSARNYETKNTSSQATLRKNTE